MLITQDDVTIFQQVLLRTPMVRAEVLWAQSFIGRLERVVAMQAQTQAARAETPEEDNGNDERDIE